MSRRTLRPVIACLSLLAATSWLSGCGEDRPERAVTIETSEDAGSESSDSSDGSPGSPDADEADAPDASAGDPLTDQQAESALLTVGDLPSGWSPSPEEDDDEIDDTIEPARCRDVLDTLDEGFPDADVEAEANFSRGGAFGTLLSHQVSSYQDEVDDSIVQAIADAFSECPRFTSTDSEGVVSQVTAAPLSLANLGDQTLAVSLTLESEIFTVAFNVAYVVTGHNVLTLISGGIAGADGAELEELARLAVTKLEEASS